MEDEMKELCLQKITSLNFLIVKKMVYWKSGKEYGKLKKCEAMGDEIKKSAESVSPDSARPAGLH